MTSCNVSARRAARIAAVALVLTAPGAAEAARNTRFESLCGRSVTTLVSVADQAVELTRECVVHIRAGGVLRIARSQISGFPRLHLRLYGRASLELRSATLTNEQLTISGDGAVIIEDSALSGFNAAFVDVSGDVSMARSGLNGGGAGVRSTRGSVSLTDSHVGARGNVRLRAGRGVSLLWSSLSGGTGSAAIEVDDRGDVAVIASVLSGPAVTITPKGAASSITLTGSDINAFREAFGWPSGMLPPDRCAAGDNLPEIECPFAPEELPDAPSGPRP